MMILGGLSHGLNATTLRRLTSNVEALLSVTGRITMLSISRWIHSKGSYRTLQRFFNTTIAWGKVAVKISVDIQAESTNGFHENLQRTILKRTVLC
jgi:hypothetical protein